MINTIIILIKFKIRLLNQIKNKVKNSLKLSAVNTKGSYLIDAKNMILVNVLRRLRMA